MRFKRIKPLDIARHFYQRRAPGKKPPPKPPFSSGGGTVPEPVEPDKPRPLVGGAAAALEFDE